MAIPVSCGRVRFQEEGCFLEHRSTSNHLMRTQLLPFSKGELGSTENTAAFLREFGLQEGDLVQIDGFLVGNHPNVSFAVLGVLPPQRHQGILSYQGSVSILFKAEGQRQLRRFDSTLLATQMLKNCPKQDRSPIEVSGTESMSSSGIISIEINAVNDCNNMEDNLLLGKMQ